MAELTFEGGLNEQDLSQVKDSECIDGYNFELGSKNTHFNPRKPFDLSDTSTNASSINGFVQLIKQDGTETTLVQSGTVVYKWDGTTFTSVGSVSASSRIRGATWSLDGYSVVVDTTKNTVISKWDGTTFSTLTTGIASNLYAKYAVEHLGRMWLFNVTTTSDTPHLMVASQFETPTSYDVTLRAQDTSFTTGEEAFYMVTPDLKPINGVALFYDTIIISTEAGRIWRLSGSNSTNFFWEPFYSGSAAIGTEGMMNIGDDVVYMKKDGVIESIRSTATFGDVKTDDLSRWILNTVDGFTSAITIYDQTRQKVYFFVGSGKVLVFFKDQLETGLSPWSVYKTNHTSSFATNAAIYMRQPGGTSGSNYFVYFGDDSGNIYQFEGTSAGDAGSQNIDAYRKSAFFETLQDRNGNPINPNIDPIRGRVYYRRTADVSLLMDFEWADDYSTPRCTVSLNGPAQGDTASYYNSTAYYGGSFYYNTGFLLTQRVSTKGFSPVGRGPGFFVSLTVQSTQNFDILKLEV